MIGTRGLLSSIHPLPGPVASLSVVRDVSIRRFRAGDWTVLEVVGDTDVGAVMTMSEILHPEPVATVIFDFRRVAAIHDEAQATPTGVWDGITSRVGCV